MSKLDQFESAFKAAAKSTYRYERVKIEKALVITDLDEEQSKLFAKDVEEFLGILESEGDIEWLVHRASEDHDVGDMLEALEEHRPDLVCTYRNLHGRARTFPFSLGAHVDVLAQATTTPIMLFPVPTDSGRLADGLTDTKRVMVLTDHMTESRRLIDYGSRLARREGTLVLTHLEDDATFERYIETISKIPAIETDVARERIRAQLLREPEDYIVSCRDELAHYIKVEVLAEVRMGHRVSDCRALVEDHSIDLVVLNTKDDDQLAMHGLAYPLAIELRDVPILML